MSFYTPLRYPGGKRRLLDFFKALIDVNDLRNCTYVEPYAGGAGLALSLLFEGYVKCLRLNDIDRAIYAFWRSVLSDTDSLCRKIMDTPINMEEWHKQKEIQGHPDDVSLVELGFSTFFLNRTNRSGILTGGVIGGKAQSGEWTMDARFSKQELIRRIQTIADQREKILFSNKDAEDYLRQYRLSPTKGAVLFFCDPPYYQKAFDLYGSFYKKEDHAHVATCITSLPGYWVVSYDNHDVIQELYKGYTAVTYGLSYTVQDKKKGTEFMAFSHSLKLPPFTLSKKGRYFSLLYDLKRVA